MKLHLILAALCATLFFVPGAEAQPPASVSTNTEYLDATPTPSPTVRTVPRKRIATTSAASATPVAKGVPVAKTTRGVPAPTPVRINPEELNNLAYFIAGMPVTSGTLAGLEMQPEWIAYANSMNARWKKFDTGRLQPIRLWTESELSHASTQRLFYPFSGPDYIYAATMFPNASTYVLCGLEPVGDIPSMEKLQPLDATLGWLQASMKTLIDAGYFVTKDMNVELKMSPLQGTLPLMCEMLARSGARITSISRDATHCEIHFVAATGGRERSLYYFSADLSNAGMGRRSAFLNFLNSVHPDAAYVKSASYLMHEEEFSAVRNYLLTQCSTIVQDDSGVPLRYFDTRRWTLQLYGAYSAPLNIFAKYYQQDLADLYAKTTTAPLTFGAGYHWDPKTATVIVATAHAMKAPDKEASPARSASNTHR
ncbi:MAG: hypothetical protein WCD79_19640 [Chthoniobacteraceae bacterium]